MAYDAYEIKLAMDSSATDGTYYTDYMQEILNEDFADAPNYESIKRYYRTNTTSTYDVMVGVRKSKPYDIGRVDRKTAEDFCLLTFGELDYDVEIGDIFEFDSHKWLTIESEIKGSVYKKVMVQRCNARLRLSDSAYTYSSDGYYIGATPLSEDYITTVWGIANIKLLEPKTEQYNISSNSYMEITLPYNSFTQSIRYDIKKGTRFLFGNPVQAWQVVDIDNTSFVSRDVDGNVSEGYSILRLNKVQKHHKDDETLMVAWQPWWG